MAKRVMVVKMEPISTDTFEDLVDAALASIPAHLRGRMENVAILIDDTSPPGPLYGLYEGTPLIGRRGAGGSSPDRITLFLATICQAANNSIDLAHRVKVTVLHEIGHHFGLGENELRELGWA